MDKYVLDTDNIKINTSGIETALVSCLSRLEGGQDTTVLLAAALAGRAAAEGHACIDLSKMAQKPFDQGDGTEKHHRCPPLDTWRRRLKASPLVGTPEQWRPLILDRSHFLYLQRFHYYEQMIARRLLALGRPTGSSPPIESWSEDLQRYFPGTQPGKTDWQKAAAVITLMRQLCIISGAPGTGKTTTAARIIGLLIDVHAPRPLRFSLCAPTGKAAARLGEALRAAADNLPAGSVVRQHFPTEAATIHRLLGYHRYRFVYHAGNPLPSDVVVVDEASMIDLALMARLIDAVPDGARLIILGDHHQLSSVEAGSVLGDICQDTVSAPQATDLRVAFRHLQLDQSFDDATDPVNTSPLSDNVVVLARNYRFDSVKGIGAIVRAVNDGNLQLIRKLLHVPGAGIEWIQTPLDGRTRRRLKQAVIDGYGPIFEAGTVTDALNVLENFTVLSALIGGPWGTDRLNKWIESLFRKSGRIDTTDVWYRGRPVIIRRNHYRAGLFNGDVGIVWPQRADGKGELRVWFRAPEGVLRSFAPQQLPEHQTAFALTVHKSQGSEYRKIVLALPERDSPVLTRELLYTGLSRARRQISLVAGDSVLDLTVNRCINRASGLRIALELQIQRSAGDVVQLDAEGEPRR